MHGFKKIVRFWLIFNYHKIISNRLDISYEKSNLIFSFFTIVAEKGRINSAGPSPQGLQRSTSLMESQPFNSLSQQNSSESNLPPFPQDSPNMPFGPNQQQQNPAGNPGNQKMGNFMDGKGPREVSGFELFQIKFIFEFSVDIFKNKAIALTFRIIHEYFLRA